MANNTPNQINPENQITPYFNTPNYFYPPENRFVGDIENGIAYPYGCYTKEESDARYLQISSAEIYVTPEMYGAVGDGVSDDTNAIQQAINSEHSVVFDGAKTYKVSISESSYISLRGFKSALYISERAKKNIYFNGATIILDTVDNSEGTNDKYSIITIDQSTEIKITGGYLIGDYDRHIGNYTEYEHCIIIMRSQNICVDNMSCSKLYGDGITIQSESSDYTGEKCSSKNIYITSCNLTQLGRNGISVIGGKYVYIDHTMIEDVTKTSPYACIDVEGNANELYDYPENIFITNCHLINERYAYRDYGRAKNVYFDNCELESLVYPAGENIVISNSQIQKLTAFVNNSQYSNNQRVVLNNSTINDLQTANGSNSYYNGCVIKASSINDGSYAQFSNCRVEGTIYTFGECEFRDCLINSLFTIDTGEARFHDSIFNAAIRCRGSYSTESDIRIIFKNCHIKYGFRIEDAVDIRGNNYTDHLVLDLTNCTIERIDSLGNNANIEFDNNGIKSLICRNTTLIGLNYMVVGDMENLELYNCTGFLLNGSAIRETFPTTKIGENIKIVGSSIISPSSAGSVITATNTLGDIYVVSNTFQGRDTIGEFESSSLVSDNNYPEEVNYLPEQEETE